VIIDPVNQNLGTPMESLGGFEFKLDDPAHAQIIPILPAGVTNLNVAPRYQAFGSIPVINGQAVLITLEMALWEPYPVRWHIRPLDDPANQTIPGGLSVFDTDDENSLSEACAFRNGFTRTFDIPVVRINDCGLPVEDVSWGEVKTLFR